MNGPDDGESPFAYELSPEVVRLLDGAVARLTSTRRTFTEEEALSEVWKAYVEVSPQADARFALACEADGTHPRHWRLREQVLANNLLADALAMGTWDGRELDAEMARLGAAAGMHYVFCPVDPRFVERADGTWDLARREREVRLPEETKAELDALGPALRERWIASGANPWTIQQVMEALAALDWRGVHERGSWTLVRAWLLMWPVVARVGQDYWVLSDHLPQAPEQTRMRVMPVRAHAIEETDEVGAEDAEERQIDHQVPRRSRVVEPDSELIPVEAGATGIISAWTMPLRTVHLVHGFIPAPAAAHTAYPPRTPGMTAWEVLPGTWYDTNDDLWLWLDRDQNRLCGPDLAGKLEWCEAGQQIRVEWTEGKIFLHLLDVDLEVQREETRLVDVNALAVLRGGLGESYRRSIQAILEAVPEGLTFRELVEAVRARQGHVVHHGTIRAILSAGGFRQVEGRWFAAPDQASAARRLRSAMTGALVASQGDVEAWATHQPDLPTSVQAIHRRLSELVKVLRSKEGRP